MPFSIPNAEMRTAKRTARKEPSIFSVFMFYSRAYSRVMCMCALKNEGKASKTTKFYILSALIPFADGLMASI